MDRVSRKSGPSVVGGELQIQNCTAASNSDEEAEGGAIKAGEFLQLGGYISVQHCLVKGGRVSGLGGGIFTRDTFNQSGGNLSLWNCTADSTLWEADGGGVYSTLSFHQTSGHLVVRGCYAKNRGGAVHAWEGEQLARASAVFEPWQWQLSKFSSKLFVYKFGQAGVGPGHATYRLWPKGTCRAQTCHMQAKFLPKATLAFRVSYFQ